jgi:hypothetical protein
VKNDIQVKLIEPKDYKELNMRYADAIFIMIKNKCTTYESIDNVIRRLQQDMTEEEMMNK